MLLRHMELRHLRYFVSVAEQGSVSKAAQQVHVSQPALSRQIRDLEAELGVQLFDRVGRGIELTAEGEDLLRHCRDVLAQAESVRERARALHGGVVGVAPHRRRRRASWPAFSRATGACAPESRFRSPRKAACGCWTSWNRAPCTS